MKLLSNIYLEFLKSFSHTLGNISSIYKSFELIHRDTVPLIYTDQKPLNERNLINITLYAAFIKIQLAFWRLT